MSNGQPVTQYWQPMHFVWSKFTMPLVYWTMAPGGGQAGVLADEPGQIAALELDLVEPHEVPGRGGQVGVALVAAEVRRVVGRQVVPLLAGHLAGLAADAEVDVDELGDLGGVAADAGRRRRRGRLAADGEPEF